MSDVFRRRKNATSDADNIEAAPAAVEGPSHPGSIDDADDLSEYEALERYISVYRDDAGRDADDDDDDDKPWWKFWKPSHRAQKPKDSHMAAIRENWFDTDIRAGLPASEIESRRKHTGWNELSAEKENLFVKFLGFFTGPILYGMLSISLK